MKNKKIPKIEDLPDIFDLVLAGLLTGYNADYLRKMSIKGEFPGYQMFPNEQRGAWRVNKADFLEWHRERSSTTKWKGSKSA